jgi:ADP-ribosylglycohydrolase
MRAAIVGVCCGPSDATVSIPYSTTITHTDPQAWWGALLVGAVAAEAARSRSGVVPNWTTVLRESVTGLEKQLPGHDLTKNMAIAADALEAGRSVDDLVSALRLTRGVTGYIAHTVPVAVYAFLRHPDDYRTAIESVIRCGGDTDTVAAITGALVGTRVGKAGIPPEWLDGWADWPRSARWIETLGRRLADGKWRESPQPALPLAWWAIPFRNLLFFLIVLAHVFRRLLPPY